MAEELYNMAGVDLLVRLDAQVPSSTKETREKFIPEARAKEIP